MPSTFSTRAVAVGLARRGWPVLPCHHPVYSGCCSCDDADCPSPGKHPRTRHGLHDATTTLSVVGRWWRQWPDANVGVRTGAHPAGAGVVVLDIDPAHGGTHSLADLERDNGPVPGTLEATTGGGGRHLWFTHPGTPVPNSAGRVAAGIDVRGDGGYALVSPSRHVSGGRYRWREAPLAAMPAWLLAMCLPPVRPEITPTSVPVHLEAWAKAALEGETSNVRAAAEGCRNHTLNRAAFALGQLVGGGSLDEADVIHHLTDAALAAGLGDHEARSTIASGIRAGVAQPRHRQVSR